MNDFIAFDDYYLVDIDKGFFNKKEDSICFTLPENYGIFKFKKPVDNIVKKNSRLGKFLYLKEDKRLTPGTIIDIVSVYGEINSYIVPRNVFFIVNTYKKKNRWRRDYHL